VEFASPESGLLESVFELLGFSHVANHKSKDVKLYRQGEINFIINYEKNSPAYFFSEEHGPSASGKAFREKKLKLRMPAPLSWEHNRLRFRLARWNCACLT
jgi:4-hydroxyphenylpyruvate dioxygenase